MPKLDLSKYDVPSGLCECGCGKKTTICNYTDSKLRRFNGFPYPRLKGHSEMNKAGINHPNYKGGKYTERGYIKVRDIGNPMADRDGFVFEHRLVMSRHVGRPLTADEHIHHINGDKSDNRIENLMIVSRSEHRTIHAIRWTKENIVEAFQKYHKQTNRLPSTATGNNQKDFPNHKAIKRVFGSLENALRESGLIP